MLIIRVCLKQGEHIVGKSGIILIIFCLFAGQRLIQGEQKEQKEAMVHILWKSWGKTKHGGHIERLKWVMGIIRVSHAVEETVWNEAKGDLSQHDTLSKCHVSKT